MKEKLSNQTFQQDKEEVFEPQLSSTKQGVEN